MRYAGGMMRRLFMALLIACLGMPAMAAPAHCLSVSGEPAASSDMVAMASRHGDHHEPAPASPAPQGPAHDCIGCIAPIAGIPAADRSPMVHAPLLAVAIAAFHALAPAKPDTPPPRA